MRKLSLSLGKKLTLLVVFMAVALSAAVILFGYNAYSGTVENEQAEFMGRILRIAARSVDADTIERYMETRVPDEEYIRRVDALRQLREDVGLEYIFVICPTEEGTYYLYDTDLQTPYDTMMEFEAWPDEFLDQKDIFLSGGQPAPIISNYADYGWLLTVYAPLVGSDGEVKGYLGADTSMTDVMAEKHGLLRDLIILMVVITAFFVLAYIYIFHRILINPINNMARAADEYLVSSNEEEGGASSISRLAISTRDELEELSVSLKSMERKINEYICSLDIATQKAERDVLTGVWNREAFKQKVSHYLSENAGREGGAFFMVDVDHFKEINDQYGHITGDEVLKRLANVCRDVFRSADLVARLGGDEYAIFCKSAGEASNMEEKARHIQTLLAEPSDIPDMPQFGTSIGIALTPEDGSDYMALYRAADEALYTAKRAGRNRYVLYRDRRKSDELRQGPA